MIDSLDTLGFVSRYSKPSNGSSGHGGDPMPVNVVRSVSWGHGCRGDMVRGMLEHRY